MRLLCLTLQTFAGFLEVKLTSLIIIYHEVIAFVTFQTQPNRPERLGDFVLAEGGFS